MKVINHTGDKGRSGRCIMKQHTDIKGMFRGRILLCVAAMLLAGAVPHPVLAKTRMQAMKQTTYYARNSYNSSAVTWEKVRETVIALDRKNRIREWKSQTLDEGGSVIWTESRKYRYKKGRLNSVKYYEKGKKIATEFRQYDEAGKILRLSLVNNRGEEFSYIDYHYDANGRLKDQKGRMNWIYDRFSYEMDHDIRKRSLIKPYRCYFKYNADGQLRKMIQKFYYLPERTAKAIYREQLTTKYAYYANGSIKQLRQEDGSHEWKKSYYNKNGRITKAEDYSPYGEDGPYHTLYRYQYDCNPDDTIKTKTELCHSAFVEYDEEPYSYYYNQKVEYSDYHLVRED